MNEGRRPRRTSPWSVNCETSSTAPPVSESERFINPASSGKIRRPAIFSAIIAASPVPSSVPTLTRTSRPKPISPVIRSPTLTRAFETRCTTARILRSAREDRREREKCVLAPFEHAPIEIPGPVRSERNVDAQPVSFRDDRLLHGGAASIEHLKLEGIFSYAAFGGKSFERRDQPAVVRRDSGIPAALEQIARQLEILHANLRHLL